MSRSHPSNNSSLPVRKPADVTTINIHEPDELRWWVEELGVAMEKLLVIVLAYGEQADVVRKHLMKTNCVVGPSLAPTR